MAALNLKQDDDWTPAKLAQHQAWRAKMYAPEKPAPKPDLLAAKLEVVSDPERTLLEKRVMELEDEVKASREEMAERLRRWREQEDAVFASAPKLKTIISAVANYYGYSVTDVVSSRRTAPLTKPRHVAMYLCKELTLRSYPEIGRHLGGRDHSTAIHGVKKIAALRLTDAALCQEVAELEAMFA